jgi:hypothetical protein
VGKDRSQLAYLGTFRCIRGKAWLEIQFRPEVLQRDRDIVAHGIGQQRPRIFSRYAVSPLVNAARLPVQYLGKVIYPAEHVYNLDHIARLGRSRMTIRQKVIFICGFIHIGTMGCCQPLRCRKSNAATVWAQGKECLTKPHENVIQKTQYKKRKTKNPRKRITKTALHYRSVHIKQKTIVAECSLF